MQRKGDLSTLLVGMQTDAATMENSGISSKKLRMELCFGLVIPLLELYLKNLEMPVQKNLHTPMFVEVLFTVARCWKCLNAHLQMSGSKSCDAFTQ